MNPGSVTGAISMISPDVTPSFLLTAINDREVTVYIYELIDDNVNVDKVQFSK